MKIGRFIYTALLSSYLLAAVCIAYGAEGIQVESTSVEYRAQPLGIDVSRPRFSWVLRSTERNQIQTAYQIRVATSPAGLERPDIWDSGKVKSGQSVLVAYAGKTLVSRGRYYWQVRSWDVHDRPSDWSGTSWWEMGLLSADDWHAKWIGHDYPLAIPKEFGALDQSSQLKPGETQGESFASSVPFKSVAVFMPTFGTSNSSATLSLYRELSGHRQLVARQRFKNHHDNDWAVVRVPHLARSGEYYIEQSEADGQIGWWTSNRSDYDFGQAYLNDQPVPGYRKIRLDTAGSDPLRGMSSELRKSFRVEHRIKSARLYATALGLYQIRINGKPVSRDLFAPGWTDYNKRVQYQTYDVTDLLREGKNALAATLAPGWYSGTVGAFGIGQFGLMPALLAQLEITYADGTVGRFVTDEDWRASSGPILRADLIMGETYDARRETPGWDLPGFDDRTWKPVRLKRGADTKLVAQVDPPISVEREIKPISVTEVRPNVFRYDFGQNMVGAIRMRLSGARGTRVTVRHAEVVGPGGGFYVANLRSARSTDVYVLKGQGVETFAPEFTFHGFRYAEVSGVGSAPQVVGRVMRTAAPLTMSLKTSAPMINQLQSNILWGQRGNFLSVPMDTPARDERLGWTGDIAAFAGTAAYNMEIAGFLRKWLIDLRDTQSADGEFAAVAPKAPSMLIDKAAPGWGDAGVIVPWVLYQQYGDRRLLEENFDAMSRWVMFLKANSSGFLRPSIGYGDWLNVSDETPKDLIATAFFAHSAAIVGSAARVLGKEPAPYDQLFAQIRDAFDRRFVGNDGRIAGDTQTAYVLALSMDLLPKNAQKTAADRLVELIKQRQWHLSTGFLGTPRLLEVLSENGHADVADRLLLQTSFPSWGYQIRRGATTMWEHWDSIKPDGTFQNASMNSFNHDAFGSVGQWMYENIAGIRPASPGFQSITIKPLARGGVVAADSRYQSLYGPIATRWTNRGDHLQLTVTIPVNTTADVWVPTANDETVDADGGVRRMSTDKSYAIYKIGSGTYRFTTHR